MDGLLAMLAQGRSAPDHRPPPFAGVNRSAHGVSGSGETMDLINQWYNENNRGRAMQAGGDMSGPPAQDWRSLYAFLQERDPEMAENLRLAMQGQ